MSVWDVYEDRMNARGATKREAQRKRELRAINNHVPENLSYQTVTVYDLEHEYNITSETMAAAAYTQEVAIINSDNSNEKSIISMPGEDIVDGSLIHWMNNYWLVTERDANTTVYTHAKLIQCNYLLRWVSDKDVVCEQWCVIEDGTKYLTGEYEDRNFVVTRGDSRIAMTIARNGETVKLGRTNRFIIDDEDSPNPIAYSLTKPLKLGNSYNKQGVFKFVLQEVTTTDDDNLELMIADYYKHFPRVNDDTNEDDASPVDTDSEPEATGRKVWI